MDTPPPGSVESLLAAAYASGRLTPCELAEAIWLMDRYFPDTVSGEGMPVLDTQTEEPPPAAQELLASSDPTPPLPASPGPPLTSASSAPGWIGLMTVSGQTPGLAVKQRLSMWSSLSEAGLIGRAFWPLRRAVSAPGPKTLDEAATAHKSAEAGVLLPVLATAIERWLDLAMVIDTSSSMALWRPALEELAAAIRGQKVFRDIRLWNINTDTAELRLRPGWGTKGAAADRSAAELTDPTGRRLILVVTDGVGRLWQTATAAQAITQWCNASPLAFINVLPERLWHRTNLPPVPATIRSPQPDSGMLTAHPAQPPRRSQPPSRRLIPAVALDPNRVAAWATLVAGVSTGHQLLTAVALNHPPVVPAPSADEHGTIPVADLVKRFRLTATPAAFQLASFLAAAPLTLPVMRLVQSLVPRSSTADLAEVFLSGLLVRRAGHIADEPDTIVYDFASGAAGEPSVREELLANLTRTDAFRVLDLLADSTTAVAAAFGGSLDFRTLLAQATGRTESRPEARPFAEATATVLISLGGDYEDLATSIRRASEDLVKPLAFGNQPTTAATSPVDPTPVPRPHRPQGGTVAAGSVRTRLADPARSRIVLVGPTRYDDRNLHNVPQIKRNTVDLAAVLTNPTLGGFPAEHCRTVPTDATLRQLSDELRAAAQEAGDLLLFYFSGHGVLSYPDGLHLAVKTTDTDNVSLTALPYDWVRRTCLGARSAIRVVILDCCYSGRATSDLGPALSEQVMADLEIAGTVVLASAPGNRAALVVAGEDHTAYTGEMLRLMREGIEGRGEYLTANDLHETLVARLHARGLPRPQQRSTGEAASRLGLMRNRRYAPVPSASPAPRRPATSVVFSYALTDQTLAEAMGAALRREGVDVRMHDSLLLEDPTIVNAEATHVVVAVVTDAYLERAETEDELSATHVSPDRKLLPVVVGLDPVPSGPSGIRIWNRIQRDPLLRLAASDDTFADLVAQVEAMAAEPEQAPVRRPEPLPREVSLWYDWEDGDLIDDMVTRLTSNQVSVRSVTSAFPPPDESDGGEVAVLWTQAARWNRTLGRAMYAADHDAVYLTKNGSPPLPAGVRSVPLDYPIPRLRRPSRNGPAPEDVRNRLNAAQTTNGGIPFHLLGDKFCASREAALAVNAAYEVAVAHLSKGHPDRQAAVLAHAAVLRFRGRWRDALEILRFECWSGGTPEPHGIALDMDLLSLRFESGDVSSILRQTAGLLRRALDEGDWPSVIAAHRLTGTYRKESGHYRAARDHLTRAYHYSEDLRDSQPLKYRVTSPDARTALTVDCLRDLAALESRADDRDAARGHLDRARMFLTDIATRPVGKYLTYVVDRQDAHIGYSETHEYEVAKRLLDASYQGLQAFSNPIRLATVLESAARLEMDFLRHRDIDAVLLQPTLEKVHRVYTTRGHTYLAARAAAALGDLQFALGQWRQAEDYYEGADTDLHRLDKKPDMTRVRIMLSRCARRLGRPDEAETILEELLSDLDGDDHGVLRAQVHSELAP